MLVEPPSEETVLLEDPDHGSDIATTPAPPYIAFRVGAAMYSFAAMGLCQSSVGVMLQPLSQHYSLSDLHVSLIFIMAPAGYVIGAQCSDLVHCTWGQRGIAVLGPALQMLGALLIAAHPPFGIVLVGFAAIALGAGFLDGSWCVWAASLPGNANAVSGMLQGSFSVGAAAGPIFAGTVLPAWRRPWYSWYYVLVAVFAVELCVLFSAFRKENAAKYREEKHTEALSARGKTDMFRYLATWLIALYFLAYVGTETAISGWIVSFMTRQRKATPNLASMASSGFWAGMAVGRFVLGVVTDRLGVGRANIIYFLFAISFQVIFAFCPLPIPSIILMTVIGFSMGPMFASGVVILTRLLPAHLHVAAVSFTASAGQIGAALLPFGIGAVVEALGIGIFRAAIVAMSVLTLSTWVPVSRQRMTFASPSCCEEQEEDREIGPLL